MAEIRVYDVVTDNLIPVTQKWCDDNSQALNDFAFHRELIRKILLLKTTLQRDLIRKIDRLVETEIGAN